VFAPYIDSPMYVTPTKSGDAPDERPPSTGGIAALDAVTGEIVWDNKVAAFVAAGATVVNDVVLSGSLDGFLRAYDIKTGDQVWEWQGPAGLNAPPAVAGDMIIIPACGPYIAAAFGDGTPIPTGTAAPAVVALKLGS
jgi:outer membrane protein assembly factor BamB